MEVRTVVFIGDQRWNGEDLFRCKETGAVYVRQECDKEYVRWLTANKWTGGYEADCPMREGLELHIADKAGRLLYREPVVKVEGYMDTVARKIAPFSWEAIRTIAKEAAEKYKLQDDETWRTWLLADKPADPGQYIENWLFGELKRGKPVKLERVSLLGKEVLLVAVDEEHLVCEKKWKTIEIRDKSLTECLGICGFDF